MAEASKKRVPRAEGARRYGPALEKAYQFVLWLIPAVEKFPRGQRFLLGDRIQTTALNALEGLIEATYSREVGAILTRVNLMLEKLRFLFRLARNNVGSGLNTVRLSSFP